MFKKRYRQDRQFQQIKSVIDKILNRDRNEKLSFEYLYREVYNGITQCDMCEINLLKENVHQYICNNAIYSSYETIKLLKDVLIYFVKQHFVTELWLLEQIFKKGGTIQSLAELCMDSLRKSGFNMPLHMSELLNDVKSTIERSYITCATIE